MRKILLGSLVLGLLGALACVGDDPTNGGGGADAGSDGTAPPPPPGGGDAGGDAATDAPADADHGPCDLTQDFATVEPLTTINSPFDEVSATLTEDELQIVFASNRATDGGPIDSMDLYSASRTSRTAAFDPPDRTHLVSVESAKMDIDGTLSGDGNLLVWSQRSPTTIEHLLKYALRGSPSAVFVAATDVSFTTPPNAGFAKGNFLLPNALYFGAIQQGDVDYTVFRAQVLSPGHLDVAAQQRLGGNETIPGTAVVVTPDELTMYVGFHAASDAGQQDDIFVYARAKVTDPWGPPKTLAIDTPANEEPRWLSPDRCRLYFTSDRANGAGGSDVYVASRPK